MPGQQTRGVVNGSVGTRGLSGMFSIPVHAWEMFPLRFTTPSYAGIRDKVNKPRIQGGAYVEEDTTMKLAAKLVASALFLAAAGGGAYADDAAAMKALDPDNDGTIDMPEALAGAKAKFAKLNPDNDGTLDAKELTGILDEAQGGRPGQRRHARPERVRRRGRGQVQGRQSRRRRYDRRQGTRVACRPGAAEAHLLSDY